MSSLKKIEQSLQNLESVLTRLGEALAEQPANPLIIDGTIQRFEFVIELYWKTLKHLLAYEGIQTTTPREALQQAYQAGWLNDETLWLQMLRDRNQISHTYNEALARQIYDRIQSYYPELKRSFSLIQERVDQNFGTD